MNNLDIVLRSVDNGQITDFHVLIQRLHFKSQQVQLQTGFSITLPNHKTHVFNF
jgi:hypothetical protein